MKRGDLIRRLRGIAKTKGAVMTLHEGASHTHVHFDGQTVTVLGRHHEIPERTAQRNIRKAEQWSQT